MVTKAYWIEGPWIGQLAILPRPRGGEWLENEISLWHESGIDLVASLLTPEEVAELDLGLEKTLCEAHGIEFVALPIPDRGTPPSPPAAASIVRTLENALGRGKRVGVHCRQGIGRSALISASLLVAAGADPLRAFERISIARGCPVPDTPEQEEWVVRSAGLLLAPAVR